VPATLVEATIEHESDEDVVTVLEDVRADLEAVAHHPFGREPPPIQLRFNALDRDVRKGTAVAGSRSGLPC
jgi:hypothetical protein